MEASWSVQEKDEMPTDHAVDNWDAKATSVNKHLIPKLQELISLTSCFVQLVFLGDPNDISPTGKSTLYLSELSEVA